MSGPVVHSGMIVDRLPWCEPVEAAARLRPLGGLAFLDSAMPHPRLGRFSTVAADPFGCFAVVKGQPSWDGVLLHAPPLDALRDLMAGFVQPRQPDLPPFQGGAIGLLSYEFGSGLHDLARAPDPAWSAAPEVCLPFYDVVLAFDHAVQGAWLLSSGLSERDPAKRPARAKDRADVVRSCLAAPPPSERPNIAIPRDRWRSNFSGDTYRDAVTAVIDCILAGEIFQANIAQRFMADTGAGFDPWPFYRRLRHTNPAPFAAFLDQGSRVVASSSPELFVAVDGNRVETRPIKGTARRAVDPDQDRLIATRLLASEKDRAENMMIVDLLRNDLSRVCQAHGVETPSLCSLESYAGVHHLVSTVTGLLRTGVTALDVLAACFPGGSITGAPKEQAMQVITQIEREARGAYCGSIACLGFDGMLASNIAIRTVSFEGGTALVHAGGGITALSDPEAEYQETLDKAERIFAAFADGGAPA